MYSEYNYINSLHLYKRIQKYEIYERRCSGCGLCNVTCEQITRLNAVALQRICECLEQKHLLFILSS